MPWRWELDSGYHIRRHALIFLLSISDLSCAPGLRNAVLRDTSHTIACQTSNSKWRNQNLLRRITIPRSPLREYDYHFNSSFLTAAHNRSIVGWQLKADREEDSTLGFRVTSAQACILRGRLGWRWREGLPHSCLSDLSLRCLQNDPHQGWIASTHLGNLLPTTGHTISPGLASKHSFPIHYSSRQGSGETVKSMGSS